MTAPTLNANRKTKKTGIGNVPGDWSVSRFDEIAEIVEGQVMPTDEPYVDYRHVGPENIDSGTGRLSGVQTSRELGLKSLKHLFDERALVYAKIRPNLNKVCWPGFVGICSADAYPIWPREDVMDRSFLLQTMLSDVFLQQSIASSMRTGMPKINRQDLSRIKIPVPPLPEQRRVAGVLGAWDRALAVLEKLRAAHQQRKQALMQQLLTGKKRFPQFKGQKWQKVRLGDVLEEVVRPITWSPDTLYHLISVRRRSGGLFRRESLHGREIKTQDLRMAKAGDFLISRMQVVHGACGLTTKEFDGLTISGSYDALVTKEPDVLDIEFFNYLSQHPRLYRLAFLASHGVHIEKMSFNLEHYLKLKIEIPATTAEQKKIVGVLNGCNRQLALLDREAAALRDQKKGLMQQLLTGKVRVKG